MITTNDDTEVITKLSLLSGIPVSTIEKLFSTLLLEFSLDYKKNKSIKIPYLGSFLVRYKGDISTLEGREAQVDAFFSPHDQIKRLVGQLNDVEKTKDYTSIDSYSFLSKLLKQDLKTVIEEENDKVRTM